MRSLSASELLNIWERGLSRSPVHRALILLAAAWPERSPAELARLSVGERDGLLLALQERLFGNQLTSVAACPKCGDRLELNFTVSDLQMGMRSDTQSNARPDTQPDTSAVTAPVWVRAIESYTVQFRLPNSLDLLAVADQPDPDRMRQLLDRCLSAQEGDRAMSVQELPSAVLDAVLTEMEQADPQANVQLALTCPACGHEWQTLFDIVSFLWSKLNAWAKRTLQEVHLLASAYGWRESEILMLSPQRRQLYLEMIDHE